MIYLSTLTLTICYVICVILLCGSDTFDLKPQFHNENVRANKDYKHDSTVSMCIIMLSQYKRVQECFTVTGCVE